MCCFLLVVGCSGPQTSPGCQVLQLRGLSPTRWPGSAARSVRLSLSGLGLSSAGCPLSSERAVTASRGAHGSAAKPRAVLLSRKRGQLQSPVFTGWEGRGLEASVQAARTQGW